MGRATRLIGVLLALAWAGLLTAGLPTVAADEAATSEESGRLVLVLDSSGSMAGQAGGGTTKIEAARAALRRVVSELPGTAEVGMRVFGATVFSRDEPGACRDSQNVVPVGPLDPDALEEAVADYEPYGETPIGFALQEAAKDLGPARDGEPRTIVLLSDGEPNCQPDPCEVAADLADRGIDLTINVVGLDVAGKARRALQCIAREGNGDYYDASSAEELASSLVKVSVRPMRAFSLDGERVTGGTTSEGALPLEPGTYVDTSLPDDGVRYYLVDRPAGGGIAASALVRPPKDRENWHTALRVQVLTPDGDQCASSLSQAFQILGITPLTAAGVEHHQLSGGYRHEECLAAEQLLVGVSLSAEPTDYLLRLMTFPSVVNAEEMPEPLETDDGDWVGRVAIPGDGERTAVAGGVSFSDAPALEPGVTYADTLRPSEQLVYRVAADYGQAVRVTARLGTDPRAAELLGIQGNPVRLWSHSALWQQLPAVSGSDAERGSGFYDGDEPTALTAVVPPLRLTNGDASSWRVKEATRGGDQFFVLGMGALDADVDFAAPVVLRAEVLGEPEGAPEYADDPAGPALSASESPDADAEADADDTEPVAAGESDEDADEALPGWVLWALGGLLVLLVLLLVVVFVLARRSRASSGPRVDDGR